MMGWTDSCLFTEAKVEFVPDIGEERLEHLKKMSELKSLMPDLEFQYYKRLNVSVICLYLGRLKVIKIEYDASYPNQNQIINKHPVCIHM